MTDFVDKKKRISVVIPNYQGEKYLSDCVLSLLSSHLGGMDLQICIVDNASEDGAIPALKNLLLARGYLEGKEGNCESYLPMDMRRPGVKLYRLKKNTGFCHAVNYGIRHSECDYVFLLNNDTKVDAACIRELAAFLDSHKDAFSVSAKMLAMSDPLIADDCGDNYSALGYARSRGKGKKADLYKDSCEVTASCGGAAMYRRRLLDENLVGLFDENHFAYLEDMDIGIRARILGYKNYYVPTAYVEHAGSAVSGSKHNAFKQRLSGRNNVYLLYKNFPIGMLLLNAPFLLFGYMVKIAYFGLKGLGTPYVTGIREGIRLCRSEKGRNHKLPFILRRLPSYVRLQLSLWKNLLGN